MSVLASNSPSFEQQLQRAPFVGKVNRIQLNSGLAMHCTDGINTETLCIERSISSRINLLVVLKGQCQAQYGDKNFTFGKAEPTPIHSEATLIAFSEAESFKRIAKNGEYVCKLVLGMEQPWLETCGLSQHAEFHSIEQFQRNHLAERRQNNSVQIQTLAQRILECDTDSFCQRLYVEGLTLELASCALNLLTEPNSTSAKLNPQEQQRIRQVVELLKSCASVHDLSLDCIARHVGSNSTTIQQQFRQQMGMTIFEYLRFDKLNQAKQALEQSQVSIMEAAFLAGYSGSTNFSTAFKRQFGMTPRQAQRRLY